METPFTEKELAALKKEPSCFVCVWMPEWSPETFHRTREEASAFASVLLRLGGASGTVEVQEMVLADAYLLQRLSRRQIEWALYDLRSPPTAETCPLTPPERAQAARFPHYWIVWYQDTFSREDPASADGVFEDGEAAKASAAKSQAALPSGTFERYTADGPFNLYQEASQRREPERSRHYLRLLLSGEPR